MSTVPPLVTDDTGDGSWISATLPVIIGLTGNALPDDVRKFRAAGAQKVVRKPATVQELHAAITGLLVPSTIVGIESPRTPPTGAHH